MICSGEEAPLQIRPKSFVPSKEIIDICHCWPSPEEEKHDALEVSRLIGWLRAGIYDVGGTREDTQLHAALGTGLARVLNSSIPPLEKHNLVHVSDAR